jgi:hypothetical protein
MAWALVAAMEMHQAGERVPAKVVDKACDEMDANCRAGVHWKIEEGRCVWCRQPVAAKAVAA